MLDLFVIGFGRPDLLREQKRLLDKYLGDEVGMCLIDNTPSDMLAYNLERTCANIGIGYMRAVSQGRLHNEALNFAAKHAKWKKSEFFGFIDHDIFPRQPTTLLDKIESLGFYGMGQTHAPSGHKYLWPGFCFFSSKWLGSRRLNFDGIRSVAKRDDGDCGSMNWPLFVDEDWSKLPSMEHRHVHIREMDSFGLQSYGYEVMGDWIHFTNASNWMKIPNPHSRDQILKSLIWQL